MTIDERTVTTALKAYARGINVTDADLERLEAQVDERLHGATDQNGRRRPWEWAVAACAVLALVLATTALWRTRSDEAMPAVPPPATFTPADLAGAWLSVDEDSNGWIWYFTANAGLDQSRRAADQFDPSAFDPSAVEPYFTVGPGDIVTFAEHEWPGGVVSVDVLPCRARVSLAPEGEMTLTPVKGQNVCWLLDDGRASQFVRVSPVSVAGSTLVQAPMLPPELSAFEPRSIMDITGTWLLKGTGTVLSVSHTSSREGEYVIDDDGDAWLDPDERGTVAFGPDGEVVLHPTEGTALDCDTVYETVRSTGNTLEMELADSSCGRVGGASGTWMRLN